MLGTGATFVKKNSCLVARVASFHTAGLPLFTFSILEPCTSKDIELDLSHVISINDGIIVPFSLLTCAFNLLTRAFNLPICAFNLATNAFSFLTRGFELVTNGFQLVSLRFELVTRISELVTRVLLFGSQRK